MFFYLQHDCVSLCVCTSGPCQRIDCVGISRITGIGIAGTTKIAYVIIMSLRQVRCCLSVCQSVSLSVRPSVRLSHFSFLALCFVYFLFVAGSINFSRWTCAALFHWALRGPLPKPTSTPMSTSTRAEL